GALVEGLGRGGHLAQVEQGGHERTRLHRVLGQRLELVGQVADRGAATQTDDTAAVAARDADATELRGLPHLEFGALRTLRLPGARLAATLTEGAGSAATGTATTTATTTGATGE